MANKTITFTRTDTESNILILAQARGYKDTINVQATNGTITQAPNTETPVQFISKMYQKFIDDDIVNTMLAVERNKLEVSRQQEDQAIEDGIKQAVAPTTVTIV